VAGTLLTSASVASISSSSSKPKLKDIPLLGEVVLAAIGVIHKKLAIEREIIG
jgi:hypothetical protein